MSLLTELQDHVKVALRAGDREKVTALRLLVSELQKAAKDKRQELTPDEELKVLRREHKRRLESAEAFSAGGRTDLETKERYEAGLIEGYLPQQMNEHDVRALIDQVVADTGASSVRDMGKVMAEVMQRGGSHIEGKEASRLVKERLSG